jgi:hypothetical protein
VSSLRHHDHGGPNSLRLCFYIRFIFPIPSSNIAMCLRRSRRMPQTSSRGSHMICAKALVDSRKSPVQSIHNYFAMRSGLEALGALLISPAEASTTQASRPAMLSEPHLRDWIRRKTCCDSKKRSSPHHLDLPIIQNTTLRMRVVQRLPEDREA